MGRGRGGGGVTLRRYLGALGAAQAAPVPQRMMEGLGLGGRPRGRPGWGGGPGRRRGGVGRKGCAHVYGTSYVLLMNF